MSGWPVLQQEMQSPNTLGWLQWTSSQGTAAALGQAEPWVVGPTEGTLDNLMALQAANRVYNSLWTTWQLQSTLTWLYLRLYLRTCPSFTHGIGATQISSH